MLALLNSAKTYYSEVSLLNTKCNVRYMETVQEVNSAYNLIAQKYNLPFNALMALYIIYEYQNVTQKMICDKLFFSKSTVHSIILDLQKQNYSSLYKETIIKKNT